MLYPRNRPTERGSGRLPRQGAAGTSQWLWDPGVLYRLNWAVGLLRRGVVGSGSFRSWSTCGTRRLIPLRGLEQLGKRRGRAPGGRPCPGSGCRVTGIGYMAVCLWVISSRAARGARRINVCYVEVVVPRVTAQECVGRKAGIKWEGRRGEAADTAPPEAAHTTTLSHTALEASISVACRMR